MKILVVGAGGIGGYYGARLIQAGAQVTFLVRPKRAEALAAQGMTVRSVLGDFESPVRTILREELQPVYDIVLLSCKAYDLGAAIDDVDAAVGASTGLLPFLNGMGVYDTLDARFGRDRVLGGVSYIAVMLTPDGAIQHFGPNDVVITGARSEAAVGLAGEFHRLIAQSPGTRVASPDVSRPLWAKWVMLATGAAMTSLMRGSVGDILAGADGAVLMRQALAECQSVAAAEGHVLSPEDRRQIEGRLLDTNSTWAASMMRDIAQGAPRLETQAIVGDMILRAERHGLQVPLLRTARCHLQVYERQRQLGSLVPTSGGVA